MTVKLGDFSPWNGHRPFQVDPARFSSTERPTISTMSTRDRSSWTKAGGIMAT